MNGDTEFDAAALVAEAQRIAQHRRDGINLESVGLGDLTPAQVDEFERQAQNDRGFLEELLGFSRESIPFVRTAFEVDDQLDRAREDIRRGQGMLDADEQADAMGRIAEDARPSSRLLGFPTGDIGRGLHQSGVLMSEMALSGGLGAAAVRGVGGQAAAVATARYASQILGAPVARESLGQILGDGGAATANVIQRAMPELKLSDEQAAELAALDEQTFADKFVPMLRSKRSLLSGFAEDVVRSGVESGGGALLKGMGRFGQLRPQHVLRAMNLRGLQKVASAADDVSTLSLRGAAYDGAWAELGEEFAEGVITEGIFGESPLDGLPETLDDLAVTVAVSMMPGSAAALWRKAHAKRREALHRQVHGDPEESTPTEQGGEQRKEASAGGERISPGEATVETTGVEPGVSSEQREADVEAFRQAYAEREGRSAPDLEVVADEDVTGEAERVRDFFRDRGVELTFVQQPNGEVLEAEGFSPAPGRAVVTLGSEGVFGVALHEGIHTWAQQQSPMRVAQIEQELRDFDPDFMARVDAYRARTMPGVEEGSALATEESVATTAQLLGPLVQYISTTRGAADMAAVREQRPGSLRGTLSAIRDWLASWVPLLPPSQRTRAQAALEGFSPDGVQNAPEMAARILEAVDSIRPALSEAAAPGAVTAAGPSDVSTGSSAPERVGDRTGPQGSPASEAIVERPLGERESADLAAEDAAYEPNRFARPLDQDALGELGLSLSTQTTASFVEDAQIVSRWDKLMVRLSDEFLAVKKYQDVIKSLGGVVRDGGPVGAIRRFFGKISDQGERIDREFVVPIKKVMTENRISVEDAGEYVESRHTPEANEHFHKLYLRRQELEQQRKGLLAQMRGLERDQQAEDGLRALERRIKELDFVKVRIPEGVTPQEYFHEVNPLSGRKTSEARALTRRRASESGFKELGKLIDRLNRRTRRKMLDGQLITQEQFDEYEAMFNHYVPLRTAEVDKPEGPRSAGFTVRGPESKRRKGRKSEASNPLAMSVVQALNVAQRVEKNAVGLELRSFLQDNAGLLESTERSDVERTREGAYDLAPNEFHMKVKGRDVAIAIHNADVARALKRVDAPRLPDAFRTYQKMMSVWRGMVTSYNPAFVTANAIRDAQTAFVNTGSVAEEHDIPQWELRWRVMKGMPSAASTTWSYSRGKRSEEGDLALFDEYSENGGQIGTFTSPDFAEQMARIERDVARASDQRARAKAARGAIAVREFVEDSNRAVETMARFSLYRELRSEGVSAKEAALAARQLTVDFAQRGTWGPFISAFYAFFSASVGGTRRMVEELARSKTGRAIAAGIVFEGMATTFLNEMWSAEDEDGLTFAAKVGEYEKRKYHLLFLPGSKDPFKLALPWGYAAFHNLGRLAAETIMGRKDTREAAWDLLMVTAENFSPMGTSPDLMQFAAPTALEPFIQIGTNTDFTGKPIAPPRYPGSDAFARHRSSGRGASELSVAIAEALNRLSGGDSVEPGQIDIAGDHVEHLAKFLGGGVASFGLRSWKSAKEAAEGTWKAERAPFIRQVYGARTEFTDSQNFYEALDEIERMEARIEDAKESGDAATARELQRRFGRAISLGKRGRRLRRDLSKDRQKAYEASGKEREAGLEEVSHQMRLWFRDYLIAVDSDSSGKGS